MILILLGLLSRVSAGEAKAAVASNFIVPFQKLVNVFKAETNHDVIIISGSTGKLYALISHGAPYDLFFAADSRRPRLLEEMDKIIHGKRLAYAEGRLVFWSQESINYNEQGIPKILSETHRMVIANPELAPYGQAAKLTMTALDIWQEQSKKLIRGENVNQALHYIKSGNVRSGFVGLSQIMELNDEMRKRENLWITPENFYEPIIQEAVLLSDNPVAEQFYNFVSSMRSQKIIKEYGYKIP